MRVLVLLALIAVAGCGRESLSDIDPRVADASRPLVFLTHPTEPPRSFVDDTGTIVGTDVDLARRIAAKMGRKLMVEGVEFSEILPRLKAGTADFGISTITITEARLRDVDFSAPYATGGASFMYKKSGKKPRMSHVASLRIGVEADTTQDLYLSRHGCDPMRFALLQEAIDALEKDELDAVFFDAPPLRDHAAKTGGRFVVTPLETRDGYGVAVDKRRPDVLAAANAVIAEGRAK